MRPLAAPRRGDAQSHNRAAGPNRKVVGDQTVDNISHFAPAYLWPRPAVGRFPAAPEIELGGGVFEAVDWREVRRQGVFRAVTKMAYACPLGQYE